MEKKVHFKNISSKKISFFDNYLRNNGVIMGKKSTYIRNISCRKVYILTISREKIADFADQKYQL